MGLGATGCPPIIPMFTNPIQERSLKTDILAKPLRLKPFMAENLFPFSKKLLVEA